MDNGSRHSITEALILASPEPLPARKIADVVEKITPRQIGQVVAELNNRYMAAGTSFRIRELAGGYQFYIIPEFTRYVEELFVRQRKMRLTRAALETVAIVAYRQPVTKTAIEHIRGVSSDGVIHTLLERKLITITGRSDKVGRPLQYGTTSNFLKFFGLASLEDLPKMSEIEELIKESQSDSSQLSFDPLDLDGITQQKLNVADGTFDPRDREQSDNMIDEQLQEPENPDDRMLSDDDDSENNLEEPIEQDEEETSDLGLPVESSQ